MRIKFLALLSIIVLAFGLTACGSTDSSKEKKESKPETTAKHEETNNSVADSSAVEEKSADTASTKTTEQNTDQAIVQDKDDSKTQSSNQSSNTGSSSKSAATTTAEKKTNQTQKASTNTAAQPAPSAPATSNPAAPSAAESQKPETTVTLSIVGPDNHVILSATKVKISEGETIFNILKGLREQYGIEVASRGSGATAYIEGIEGNDFSYFEFDEGPTSGWVFKQNGASLTKSVGVTTVKDGDRIEGIYTK
ncbi:DUF4430 domain-containing protein [Neobacillus niacini]|uniref:DUF4430 domain-containing protein n=1 Tax=Neobacillus niacini TaxID=86668 RepID=UPI0021CB220E|nr:DUF4430 domain-containing protein [Neobacillus niacini]MCM3764312.1 DUF4430 domain-containing protein [Neobacillus niacini]